MLAAAFLLSLSDSRGPLEGCNDATVAAEGPRVAAASDYFVVETPGARIVQSTALWRAVVKTTTQLLF